MYLAKDFDVILISWFMLQKTRVQMFAVSVYLPGLTSAHTQTHKRPT